MPAVHAEALHDVIVPVTLYNLVKTGIGRGEFGIVRFLHPGAVFAGYRNRTNPQK